MTYFSQLDNLVGACGKVKKRNPLFFGDLKQNLLFEVNSSSDGGLSAYRTLDPKRHPHNAKLNVS